MKDKEKDICALFERGLKALRAYTKNSKAYKKTVEDIKKEIEEFNEVIKLKLEDLNVIQNDLCLYKKNKKEDNIFFPLYRDGLREMEIDPNIDEDEIEKLIDVLNFDILKVKEDIDTVGFLWQMDLKYISYKAIDGIGDSSEGFIKGDEFSKAVEELISNLKEKPSPYKGEDSKYKMIIERDIKLQKLLVENKEAEKFPFEETKIILGLSQDEINAIKNEVLEVENEDREIVIKFARILFYMLKNKKYKEKEIIKFYFEKIFNTFLELRDWEALLWFLKEIEKINEIELLLNTLKFLNEEILSSILSLNLSEEDLKFILKILLEYLPDFFVKLHSYFPKENIAEYFYKNPKVLEYFLKNEDKTIFILNFSPKEILYIYFDKIKSFLNSNNQNLREAICYFIFQNPGLLKIDEILMLINDQNQNIRVRALKAIENEKLAPYLEKFFSIVESKNFQDMGFLEKKLILKIILSNSSLKERKRLNNLLPKKKLFISKKEKKKAFDIAKILIQFEEGKKFLEENKKYWKKYMKGE